MFRAFAVVKFVYQHANANEYFNSFLLFIFAFDAAWNTILLENSGARSLNWDSLPEGSARLPCFNSTRWLKIFQIMDVMTETLRGTSFFVSGADTA